MYPAALAAGLRPNLIEGGPESQVAVTDRQLWRRLQAARQPLVVVLYSFMPSERTITLTTRHISGTRKGQCSSVIVRSSRRLPPWQTRPAYASNCASDSLSSTTPRSVDARTGDLPPGGLPQCGLANETLGTRLSIVSPFLAKPFGISKSPKGAKNWRHSMPSAARAVLRPPRLPQ